MRQYKIEKVNLNGFGERKYYAVVDDARKQVSLHYETLDDALYARRRIMKEEKDRQRLATIAANAHQFEMALGRIKTGKAVWN
jgi:hypothetical protein